jgi:GNAT superfamily N-acetyltransferase
MQDDIEIGRASRDEVDTMIEWAAREGWNPGLGDAACFWDADPEGFWVARHDGDLAGCISLVRYGRGFGFLGFFIVAPELRGRGIGQALWDHAMHQRGSQMVIGLDGVLAQELSYRKAGFFRTHRNIRYGGTPGAKGSSDNGLTAIGPEHMDAIAAYDLEFFPAPRRKFLDAWLAANGHTALAAFDGEDVKGYGVVRPCRDGHKIGPLFADDPETAERLFDALASEAGGKIFVDPPFANDDALELYARKGLEPVFETVRMYHGNTPRMRFPGMYGITSFELG